MNKEREREDGKTTDAEFGGEPETTAAAKGMDDATDSERREEERATLSRSLGGVLHSFSEN